MDPIGALDAPESAEVRRWTLLLNLPMEVNPPSPLASRDLMSDLYISPESDPHLRRSTSYVS